MFLRFEVVGVAPQSAVGERLAFIRDGIVIPTGDRARAVVREYALVVLRRTGVVCNVTHGLTDGLADRMTD